EVHPPPLYVVESYMLVFEMLDEVDPARLNELVRRSHALRDEYDQRHSYWAKTLPEGPLKHSLIDRSADSATFFFEARDRGVPPRRARGAGRGARRRAPPRAKPLYQEHRKTIDEVVGIAADQNVPTEHAASDFVAGRATAVFVLGLVIMIMGSLISWLAIR